MKETDPPRSVGETVAVSVTVSPYSDGASDEVTCVVVADPMFRHASHVSAVDPGRITVMSRFPRGATDVARRDTVIVVELTTCRFATTTPVPDTKSLGVPVNPLPVSVTVSAEPPAPMFAGSASVIGGPGVVTLYAMRLFSPATSRSLPANTGCAKISGIPEAM